MAFGVQSDVAVRGLEEGWVDSELEAFFGYGV